MNNMLLQIRVFHQYYDDNLIHQIMLQPDDTTSRFLLRYGLILKQDLGGISIYFFGTGGFTSFCQSLTRLLTYQPLVFNIKADSQKFMVISELPINTLGQLHYSSFDSRNTYEQIVELKQTLLTGKSHDELTVGQISIYPQDLFNNLGKRVNRCFDIRIEARQTYWFYYVFNRSGVKLQQPMITKNKEVLFEPPVEVTFDNGEPALLFSSGHKRLSLSETIKTPLMLVNNNTSDHSTANNSIVTSKLLKILPIPQTDKLNTTMRNKQRHASSDMYVYI